MAKPHRTPTASKKSNPPVGATTLDAVRLRIQSACRPGASISHMRQAQALTVDSIKRLVFVLGPGHEFVAKAQAAERELLAAIETAEAGRVAARPPKHLTTVGDLKRLLAGLPDSTRLDEIPLVDPKWTAAASAALALLPPVQQLPEAAATRLAARPFGTYGMKSAAEVLDA